MFKNASLLKEALTHRSYLNENPNWSESNNERLEFLGDAVLELVVTNYLFKIFPKSEEGELTLLRAALVNTKMLSSIAEGINLNKYLLVSKGESFLDGRAGESMLADAFEALIGAIYLDQGYSAAERFISDHVISKTEEVRSKGIKDSKSTLQEVTQNLIKETPVYKIIGESGPEHKKVFEAGVYLKDELRARGSGASKQEAELDSASRLLELIMSGEFKL